MNGKAVSIADAVSDAPALVDISEMLHPGENGIAVQNGKMFSTASVQAVAEYYVPWSGAPAGEGLVDSLG